ncbi:MAG: RNA-directed DNA polymerase [Candidatus Micrarchaeales archaeon]
MSVVQRKIKDPDVIWLIKTILKNHKSETEGKGMPIGNLTSQFFANVYLNELDQFVKHTLKAKCYIRYVDDFVILHTDRKMLEKWRAEIDEFLHSTLKVQLHPEKTRVVKLNEGVTLLGFRVFYKYKLLKKSNAKRIWKRLDKFKQRYDKGEITTEEVIGSLEGWFAYAKFADTYTLRKKVAARFNDYFKPP